MGLGRRELSMFALALVGLTSFVVVELRRRVPMVDFGFFRSRTFAAPTSSRSS